MSDLEEKKKAHIDNIIEQHKDNKTIKESELMNSLDKLELTPTKWRMFISFLKTTT